MNRVVVIWGVPRSTSTAFEWMMRMRGDMNCFHEPFGEVWYQGEDPLWPRATPDSPRTPGLTAQTVIDTLDRARAAGPVFIKDMAHHTDHLWTDEFLERFTHSFLIRDPAKVVTSVYTHWPDFVMKEIGYPDQLALYERVTALTGKRPPVLDSDDMLEDPPRLIERWSEAVGIPYREEALTWEPGARDEVSWYDGGSWHDNLRNSDGLKPQPRKAQIDISEAPARVREVYAEVMPMYRAMWEHRLGR